MRLTHWVAVVVAVIIVPVPAHARRRAVGHPAAAIPVYETALTRWSAATGGFASWELAGTKVNAAGELELDVTRAVSGTDPYGAGGFHGGNFYNGASFMMGEATSPIVDSRFGIAGAFPSWNAATPPGTWVETLASRRINGVWTQWYSWGVWDDDNSTVSRHSWSNPTQGTASDSPAAQAAAADAIRVRIRLFSETGTRVPTVRNASIHTAATPIVPPVLLPGDPSKWDRLLDVPRCSQMVYPDGGKVWCSPTSTSMVLAYLRNDTGDCEPRVRAATVGTYDWILPGYGNWLFNAAYAGTFGFNAYATRFTSMREVETWVSLGIPVVFNFAWSAGQLTGAAIPSSSGHLAVFVGFDAEGNPIVNDPAAPSNATVRRTYLRSELERVWLTSSGGAVYLIYPYGFQPPPGY
ncbi:MAG: C39 family peptidase [Thermoanaerobaculia bacterium]